MYDVQSRYSAPRYIQDLPSDHLVRGLNEYHHALAMLTSNLETTAAVALKQLFLQAIQAMEEELQRRGK